MPFASWQAGWQANSHPLCCFGGVPQQAASFAGNVGEIETT